MKPQLLTDCQHPETLFRDGAFAAEEKLDGDRRLVVKRGNVITATTRNGNVVPLSETALALAMLSDADWLIDGEAMFVVVRPLSSPRASRENAASPRPLFHHRALDGLGRNRRIRWLPGCSEKLRHEIRHLRRRRQDDVDDRLAELLGPTFLPLFGTPKQLDVGLNRFSPPIADENFPFVDWLKISFDCGVKQPCRFEIAANTDRFIPSCCELQAIAPGAVSCRSRDANCRTRKDHHTVMPSQSVAK